MPSATSILPYHATQHGQIEYLQIPKHQDVDIFGERVNIQIMSLPDVICSVDIY